MKQTILSLAFTMILAGTITTSCDTAAQKEETAKKEVKDAKEDLKEAQNTVNASANAEEWNTFKDEIELKIKANEVRISELKLLKKKPGKVFDKMFEKNIETLEKRNAGLRVKLTNYEASQSDWEAFKREFNSDMDGIKKSLEDLSVDNKK